LPQIPQSHKPTKLNLDVSKKYLPEDSSAYLLNVEINHPDALGKSIPFVANEPLCELEQPAGETYVNGSGYYNPITNEAYSWHYNSKGVHYILRVSEKGCEIVYSTECLKLSADPKHSIEQWRAYLKIDHFKADCSNQHGKQLIFTDGTDEGIFQIDVEASVATKFFTTPFFDKCANPCDFIKMCVPQPCGSITAAYIPVPDKEKSLSNHLLDVGFKFMFRHVYYDNRASEWSDRSTLYFQDTKGCFDSVEGFSRCMELEIPIGNPMVDRIEIAFNKGGSEWFISDVVEKYAKYTSGQQKWYERKISPIIGVIDEHTCTFKYKFCNDKQCKSIDPTQVTRVFNPMPRKAQCLIPIKNALGFVNYEKGLCPVDKKEIEKIKVELDCKDDSKECEVEFTDIKVRAIIYNPAHHVNQFIWRNGAGTTDDPTDTAKFGGINPALDGGLEDPTGHDQYFRGKTRNFNVYIEGTAYSSEMKQWHSEKNWRNREQRGIVDDGANKKVLRALRADSKHGGFFYQEATIKVPTGMKGFLRLSSHAKENVDVGSSTFVMGVYNNLNNYFGRVKFDSGDTDFNAREIYFDTCGKKELDIESAFVVQDNAADSGDLSIILGAVFLGGVGAIAGSLANPKPASSYYGYVRDAAGRPVEGAIIAVVEKISGVNYNAAITDHNGFYHFFLVKGYSGEIDISVLVEKDCGAFSKIKKDNIASEPRHGTSANITISKDDSLDYQQNSRAIVRVKVEDCDGHGVDGIRVAVSGAKYGTTKHGGYTKIYIRNYNSRDRQVRVVVIDHKGCFGLDCNNNCSACLESLTSATPACYWLTQTVGMPTQNPLITFASSIKLNKKSADFERKGLKMGGRYPIGIVVQGECDRLSAVYELPYLDIPKAQEVGKVKYCGLKYSSLSQVTLPLWANCLKIVRGTNVNPFELQWVVDKIEPTSDGKLKLTIQSLNDYDAKYNFKTNTIYQWLKGDRVEFIRNGDGKVFSSVTSGVLNYLTISPFHDEIESGKKAADVSADYFNQLLIEDDGQLSLLQEGAVIELQRSKECVTEPIYYEIAVSIPVVNGLLVHPNGTFTTFDTYLVNRKIGKSPSQYFEHHSPSDFWGERLDDTGKAHVVNKYENEKRYGRNISINAAGQFNYFGDLEKTFANPNQGDITAMSIFDKIIMGICENGNFIAQASDDLVRVGADGTIRALPADSIISDEQSKISAQFGCQYPHIGSVFFGDGWARWVDVNKHADVKHDYNLAKDVSEGKAKTYFRKRCQDIESANKKENDFLNHYRFATGFNTHTGALMETIKKLRDSGINDEHKIFQKSNDTLLFNPLTDEYLTFTSFTPEAYSRINLFDGKGAQFICYLHGQPFVHPIHATKWNEFFGVAVNQFIGFTMNAMPKKIKEAVSMEIVSTKMFFVKEVTTENANFISEVPAIRIKKIENKFNCEFLGNINSRGGLYNGESARGYYIDVLLQKDNTNNLVYGSVNTSKQTEYSEMDSIFTKMITSENSGLENT